MATGLPNDHLQVLMYKLSLAGSQIPVGPVYDPDAEAYFAAVLAGSGTVISDSEKQNISNFIEGEKLEGRWDNAVDYWTLRSIQNAGTSTILYSMKGVYDGALSNCTWGTDGMLFDSGDNSNISTSLMQPISVTMASCFAMSAASGQYVTPIGFQDNNLCVARRFTDNNFGIGLVGVADPTGLVSIVDDESVFLMGGGTKGNISVSTSKNGTARVSANLTAPYPGTGTETCNFGRHNVAGFSYFDGTVSFNAIYNIELTNDQISDAYLNYKTTIGQGLSLP